VLYLREILPKNEKQKMKFGNAVDPIGRRPQHDPSKKNIASIRDRFTKISRENDATTYTPIVA
jgi:hypothetical protein